MSQQLYIIYSAITLDFMANGYKVIDGFFPEEPEEGAESITESFKVLIIASSESDLRSKINAIRLAFMHAKNHKNDALAAYLYYDVSDSGDAWMSKILGGEFYYDEALVRRWKEYKAVLALVIEHEPYWDAKDEVQVPLTNGNGTNNTSGLQIFNHDDGGGSSPNHHDNWVEIAATDISGDLPGPTRLEMVNNYDSSTRLGYIWIGQNWTDPDNLAHIIEGENSSLGTVQSSAQCSGGEYIQWVLASGAETNMFHWLLTDALLNACKGGYFKIMARFQNAAQPAVKFRLKLMSGDVVIWQSGQVTIDNSGLQIRDFFTLRLPPWLIMQTNFAMLDMLMTGQQNTGSSINVNLDYLQLTPLDGWRSLQTVGDFGVPYTYRLVDDGFTQEHYTDDGAGNYKAGIVIGYGNPITLYPGKKQRLYFLMHGNIEIAGNIERTALVKLYYRPRRKTL